MMKAKDIFRQINVLTQKLIEVGLCDYQNYPSIINKPGKIEEVSINNPPNSISLKNIPYAEMYKHLSDNQYYNFKMLDGALITMQYRFKNNNLIAHRLSFFPSPDLELFQNEPELYLEDELYADILDKRIVTVPFRFDFDYTEGTYKPIDHPISHLTIGQYEYCRIPVSSALTPYQFIAFIIRNFYHTAGDRFSNSLPAFKECFDSTIFDEEKALLHINTPSYNKS